LILQLADHPDGVETGPGDHVVYDVATDRATFGEAKVDGRALVWTLTERPRDGDWLVRCDRVDFPPGSVAHLHTHPGPGLRVLLKGRIRIETEGSSREYGPFEWWYETGPDPVFAAASESEETAFVRVLVLPREWEGKRTIRYVDPADEDKPKLQRAHVYFEHAL
jgi:quercetin dioxygenase-like cupin family protein